MRTSIEVSSNVNVHRTSKKQKEMKVSDVMPKFSVAKKQSWLEMQSNLMMWSTVINSQLRGNT